MKIPPFTISLLITACTALAAVTANHGIAQDQRVEATVTTTSSTGTLSEFGSQGISIKTPAGTQPIRFMSNDTTNYVDEEGNPVPLGSVEAGQPVTIHYTKVGDTLIASKVVVNRAGKAPAPSATIVVPGAPAPAASAVTERTTTTTTVPGAPAPAASGVTEQTTTTTTVPGAPAVMERTTTTTTTSTGTIAEMAPGAIVVRSETAPEPLRYRYTENTTYVDEAGAPVSFETVRMGLPVTVHYARVGDGLVATRVVVRTGTPVAPTPPTSISIPGKVATPGAEVEVQTKKTTTTIER